MKYRVVTSKHGVLELNDENLIPALEVRGFKFVDFSTNMRLREELHGQPQFDGLAGPMWDGDAVRYEDADVCRALSI